MTTPGFRVDCSDPALGEQLDSWLAREFPIPDHELELQVEVAGAVERPGTEPVFEQPTIQFFRAPGDPLTVAWTTHPAVARIGPGPCATIVISPETLRHVDSAIPTFFAAVVTMLLRRVGWHHVHAAMLEDPNGRCWLFAGNSQSGKSTTAALLAARGWRLGGDDGVFLSLEGDRVMARPLTKNVALRPTGMSLLAKSGGRFRERRGKTEFGFAELTESRVPLGQPEIVAFTSVGGESTRVEPISGAKVLAQLVRWSAWVALEKELAQEHLELLAGLGRQSRCYSITLAEDLTENPEMLMEAIT